LVSLYSEKDTILPQGDIDLLNGVIEQFYKILLN